MTNRMAGRTTNECMAIPTVTASTNIPSCENDSVMSVILAMTAAIRLPIPIGPNLKYREMNTSVIQRKKE